MISRFAANRSKTMKTKESRKTPPAEAVPAKFRADGVKRLAEKTGKTLRP